MGVSTININLARDIQKFDDFGKPVSRSSCPYSDLKCLINVDATVDIEMRKSTFDEMINFGQANVKMALGQSSDFLLHKFDVSMAQANQADIENIPSAKFGLEFNQKPEEPVLTAFLESSENSYDLFASFGNDETRARGQFEVTDRLNGPQIDLSYDLSGMNSLVSFSSNLPVEIEPIPFKFGVGWNFSNDFTAGYLLSFDPEVSRARRSAARVIRTLTHADFSSQISKIFDSAQSLENSQALHVNLNAAELKTQFVMKTEKITELRKLEADWSMVPLETNLLFVSINSFGEYFTQINFDVKTLSVIFGPEGPENDYFSIGYDFPEPMEFKTHFVQKIEGVELLQTMNTSIALTSKDINIKLKTVETNSNEINDYQLTTGLNDMSDGVEIILTKNDETMFATGASVTQNGLESNLRFGKMTLESALSLDPNPKLVFSFNGDIKTAEIRPILDFGARKSKVGFVAIQERLLFLLVIEYTSKSEIQRFIMQRPKNK